MKLSKTEIKLNFALFAVCVQIAYTLKEQAATFFAKVRDTECASVDDACTVIFETAKSLANVSILQILVGKPNFFDNPAMPRKSIALPEGLFKFPQKVAHMSQDAVCGIAVKFSLVQVHSEELELVKTFLLSNRRMTVSDFSLALASFCSALAGVQILGLACHDPFVDKLVDLPIRNTRLLQTLPTVIPRNEEAVTRIMNFFKVLDEHHSLLSGLDRILHAFRTQCMTGSIVTETERVFFALGRKLDALKRTYAADAQNNVLIEATQCFLFAQQVLIHAKGMPQVADVDVSGHATYIFGSMNSGIPVKKLVLSKRSRPIEDIDEEDRPVPKKAALAKAPEATPVAKAPVAEAIDEAPKATDEPKAPVAAEAPKAIDEAPAAVDEPKTPVAAGSKPKLSKAEAKAKAKAAAAKALETKRKKKFFQPAVPALNRIRKAPDRFTL